MSYVHELNVEHFLDEIISQLPVEVPTDMHDIQEKYRVIFEVVTPQILYSIRKVSDTLSDDDITDIAADIWENIWNKIDTYDPEKAKFVTWANRIAHNKTIDFLRKRKNYEMSIEDIGTETSELTSISDECFEEVITKDIQLTALNALMDLPTLDRSLYLLRMSFDVTYAELAQVASNALGKTISEKAVQNRVYRVRQKIFEIMQSEGLIS